MVRIALPALLIGALFSASCQPNPLGLAPAVSSPAGITTLAVVETVVPGLVFMPNATFPPKTTAAYGNANMVYSMGRYSSVRQGPSSAPNPDGTNFGGGGAAWYGGPTVLLLGPYAWLCPSGTCLNTPKYRGIGGPNGDYSADYFVRWQGHKGTDASLDFSSVQMNFGPGDGVPKDVSNYRGVVFWARGHGNFAINLAAKNGLNTVTGSVQPYTGWNFYLRRFGNELNGDEDWKQIIVYFTDMVQEFGLAADKQLVLENISGLHFDQQSPYTQEFQLDIDYVQFF